MNYNFKKETTFKTMKGTDKTQAILECFDTMTNENVISEYGVELEKYTTYLKQDTSKAFRSKFQSLIVRTNEGSVRFN